MKINSNWRNVAEAINGSVGAVGFNTGEGLGMKYGGELFGPQDWAGSANWDAGNCIIIVNSDEENTTLIELYP